jgi:hypothetical protein
MPPPPVPYAKIGQRLAKRARKQRLRELKHMMNQQSREYWDYYWSIKNVFETENFALGTPTIDVIAVG